MKIALSSTVCLMTKYVHKRPDSTKFQFVLRVPSELAHRYLLDFIRLNDETATAKELYERMLARQPDRANPGSRWSSAQAAKKESREAPGS